MSPHDACISFIGGSGWVTAFVALRENAWWARAVDRVESEKASIQALADDQADYIGVLEADVEGMSSALCDANAQSARDDGAIARLVDAFCFANHRRRVAERKLAEHQAHPGRAMRALQLAQTKPAAAEGRLLLDPVWRQAHPDQVAA